MYWIVLVTYNSNVLSSRSKLVYVNGNNRRRYALYRTLASVSAFKFFLLYVCIWYILNNLPKTLWNHFTLAVKLFSNYNSRPIWVKNYSVEPWQPSHVIQLVRRNIVQRLNQLSSPFKTSAPQIQFIRCNIVQRFLRLILPLRTSLLQIQNAYPPIPVQMEVE